MMTRIAEAVEAERARTVALFDQLRADGADPPGVSRDPYGRASSVPTPRSPPRPSAWGWRSRATPPPTST